MFIYHYSHYVWARIIYLFAYNPVLYACHSYHWYPTCRQRAYHYHPVVKSPKRLVTTYSPISRLIDFLRGYIQASLRYPRYNLTARHLYSSGPSRPAPVSLLLADDT